MENRKTRAGKMPALQNRNAPAGAGAQFLTRELYQNGNTGQVKKLGAKGSQKT
jgi:hypothetical protein